MRKTLSSSREWGEDWVARSKRRLSMDSQPPRQYEKIIAYTVKIDGGCSAHLEKHEKDQLCMELNYCLNKGNPHTDEVMRLESIEGVSKIQEEPNKPIQPNGTVRFGGLRGDSNKH
ncbi:unnamed protein product [Arabidopsis lyrata]|nr:unnamed protein product [Arabidopsis lyrata]